MFPYYPGCVWRGELLCLFVAIPCCHVDNQFAFHQPSWEAKVTKTSQTHIYLPGSVSEGGQLSLSQALPRQNQTWQKRERIFKFTKAENPELRDSNANAFSWLSFHEGAIKTSTGAARYAMRRVLG